LFHILNVLSNLLNALSVGALEKVVHSISLICCDEVLIDNCRKWDNLGEFRFQLVNQIRLQNVCSFASIEQIGRVNVPTMDEHIARIDHRHDLLDWLVDIFELFRLIIVLVTNMSGGTLGKRPMEIWVLDSSFGLP